MQESERRRFSLSLLDQEAVSKELGDVRRVRTVETCVGFNLYRDDGVLLTDQIIGTSGKSISIGEQGRFAILPIPCVNVDNLSGRQAVVLPQIVGLLQQNHSQNQACQTDQKQNLGHSVKPPCQGVTITGTPVISQAVSQSASAGWTRMQPCELG